MIIDAKIHQKKIPQKSFEGMVGFIEGKVKAPLTPEVIINK